LGEPSGSEPGYLHPHVVIQNNVVNRSRINTVIVCGITSNLRLAQAPGNILLKKGEANLPKQSVVNVSRLFSADKRDLFEKIGTLSPKRVRQIIAGLMLLLEPEGGV
jgi:mRNA interferase MazF